MSTLNLGEFYPETKFAIKNILNPSLSTLAENAEPELGDGMFAIKNVLSPSPSTSFDNTEPGLGASKLEIKRVLTRNLPTSFENTEPKLGASKFAIKGTVNPSLSSSFESAEPKLGARKFEIKRVLTRNLSTSSENAEPGLEASKFALTRVLNRSLSTSSERSEPDLEAKTLEIGFGQKERPTSPWRLKLVTFRPHTPPEETAKTLLHNLLTHQIQPFIDTHTYKSSTLSPSYISSLTSTNITPARTTLLEARRLLNLLIERWKRVEDELLKVPFEGGMPKIIAWSRLMEKRLRRLIRAREDREGCGWRKERWGKLEVRDGGAGADAGETEERWGTREVRDASSRERGTKGVADKRWR